MQHLQRRIWRQYAAAKKSRWFAPTRFLLAYLDHWKHLVPQLTRDNLN